MARTIFLIKLQHSLQFQGTLGCLVVHHHHWQNSPFWFCQVCLSDHPVFTSFHFATTIFLQNKSVSLASNPQPGRPGPCIYVPQWQSGPAIIPITGFPFRRLLGLAGLRRRYSNPPSHGNVLMVHQTKLRISTYVSRFDLGRSHNIQTVTEKCWRTLGPCSKYRNRKKMSISTCVRKYLISEL
jgi:hypothetical protein